MKGKVGGRVTRRQFTASPGIIWCADGYSSITVGGPTLHPFHPPPPMLPGPSVAQFGWLTPQQFVDGLALGQFTPGPVLMLAAFIGF
jgi:Chromate transporter